MKTMEAKVAEIKRLRDALQKIAYPPSGTGPNLYESIQIARAALKADTDK